MSGPPKVTALIPTWKRRRSRAEVRRLFQEEKSQGRWNADRDQLLKKLNQADEKHVRPKAGAMAVLPRTNPAGGSASSDSAESESAGDSDEDSESDVEVEAEEPSPVPLTRPTDPNKALEYDLIKTVWAKRRQVLSATVIRTALSECWDKFKEIRDKWKTKTTHLQQAIDKKDAKTRDLYQRRVTESRKLLESCIRSTLQHGHPSIVQKLGENPHLLILFYQFLADRIKAEEYGGSFIGSILELIARCHSIDTTLLEKTKIDKVLTRLVKKSDEPGRKLAQSILDDAATMQKQKATGATNASSSKGEVNGASTETQADLQTSAATKSASVDTKGLGVIDKNGGKSAAGSKQTGTGQSAGGAESSKVKVVQTAAKPSTFFAGLQSASKKPGTSTKGKDVRPSTESTKGEEPKPAPKPAFSFAATMANLAKQKQTPETKPEGTRKPETPEEKAKRLRKEQRRKLRVSFKSDSELVQIREFVHDPEEELGHEDSQVRDVGDSRGEGQMLKMNRDLDLMDEDEDYEPPEEIILPTPPTLLTPWVTPLATDFKEMVDVESNYIGRGGNAQPKGDERKIQEERESNTLLVVYSNRSDIPPSPREPIGDQNAMDVDEVKFGEPNELVRQREAEYRANLNKPAPSAATNTPDISNILRILNSQGMMQQQGPFVPNVPQPQHTAPTSVTPNISDILARAANPANSAQQHLLSQAQPAAPASGASDISALLARIANTANQGQPQPQQASSSAFNYLNVANMGQASQAQQYPSQPNFGGGQPSQPTQGAPDLQAILARIQTQQQGNQAPQMANFGFNVNNQPYDNDRKRQYDADDQGEYGAGKRHRGDQQNKNKYQPRLPCRYWQEGKCRKGKDCTFLHEQ